MIILGNEMTELRSIITKTRANVGVLNISHLVTLEQVGEKATEKPSALTISYLESLWPSLEQLEGTGLEGEGVTDSLLADIETSLTLEDSSRTLIRQVKQRKKPSHMPKRTKEHRPEISAGKNDVNDNIRRECEETQESVDWWGWYNSWKQHITLNKTLIQQQEYLRIMRENI